jgi:predicted nucleic acid-binding protein
MRVEALPSPAVVDASVGLKRAVDEPGSDAAAALALAAERRHPVYDCCYLEVALARGTVMVTADRRFWKLVEPHATLATRVVRLDQIEL